MVAERADDDRLDQVDLPPQVVLAGLELARERVAIVRRPALERVGDEHLLALQADLPQQLVEQLSRLPDERESQTVLVGAGGLTDEHQLRVRIPRAEHNGRPRLVQRAANTHARLLPDRLQELAALTRASHQL